MQPTSYPACSAFSRWVIAAVGVLAMGAVLSRTGLAVHATQGLVSGVFLAFGFFTIWTNTAVAAICFWVATRRRWSPLSCGLMTGATAMILFVGLVYHFLLHGSVRFGSVAGLTETALHYIVPAAMMLVWLGSIPRRLVPLLQPLIWISFPAVYLLVIFSASAATGRYPYYFLDVSRFDLGGVSAYVAVLLLAILSLSFLFIALDRLLPQRFTQRISEGT